MVAAFKKADFFTGSLAPSGLDKGLDYENTLDVLSHFMTKMMNDTNWYDLSDKTGLLVTGKLSLEDLVQEHESIFPAPTERNSINSFSKTALG